jgi:methylmalonyl-CoA mutase cobalamin-binding domain/chain
MSNIVDAFENLKVSEIDKIVSERFSKGEDPYLLLNECQEGMKRLGERFETGEYYLAELILSAKMFEKASALLTPKLKERQGRSAKSLGKIVLGTPKGDIHDLGKNIFRTVAEAEGFEVIDLGIDVPPEGFSEMVRKEKPDVVGMSALITTAYPAMKEVVELLTQEGLRKTVKVIIGGGAVSEEVRRLVGADAYTLDANKGLSMCREFVGV